MSAAKVANYPIMNFKEFEENQAIIEEENKISLKNEYIEEYNQTLIGEKILLTAREYIIQVNERFFVCDIEFMDEFMELCKSDEFCIPHSFLLKYGVVLTDRSNDIKKCIDRNKLTENEDYLLRHVAQRDITHGGSNKKSYMLTPDAFKMCLIRAKNTRKYAKYYLFLEKALNYYDKYQRGLTESYNIELTEINIELNEQIEKKDESIRRSEELMNRLQNKMEEQDKKMNRICDHINLSLEARHEAEEQVEEVQHQIEEVQEHIEEILPQRVIQPANKCKDIFRLYKVSDTHFAVGCWKSSAKKQNHAAKMKKHPGAIIFFQLGNHPNSETIFQHLKEQCKDLFRITRKDIYLKEGVTETVLQDTILELERNRLEA
jgi:polyhydroxyalkanoate synthesis regulator protein